MLVLARGKKESIIVGKAGDVLTGPIVVSVSDVRGEQVRIGIEADRNISIYRSEVQDRIDKETRGEC